MYKINDTHVLSKLNIFADWNFLNEKTIYTRENQLDTFKTKIKPIMGRSFKHEEFVNIVNLKDDEFKNIIKK